MAGEKQARDHEPRLVSTLLGDARQLLREIRRVGLRQTLNLAFTELEAFYLSSGHQTRLAAMGRGRRWLFLAAWLLKSLFLKLTPTRRVLFCVSLVLLMGETRFVIGDSHVGINFNSLGALLLVLILMLELKDKLLAREELEAGRAVQNALMPEPTPEVPGWEVWLYTRAANDVGGDLVDHLRLDGGRHGIALGDASGKGLPAALLMARLQATLRALAPDATSLAELGAKVNRILHRDRPTTAFASLVYLELRPDSGRVRLLNAGHMPPVVLRAAGITEMPRGELALGLLAEAAFSEQVVELDPGEGLLLYSDGVTEEMNPAGELYGWPRLETLLARAGGRPPEQLGREILQAIDAFAAGAPAHDDISLVLIRRR